MASTAQPLGGRVAIVGTGSRAAMFVRGIVARPTSHVVAICEPNAVRAAYYNALLAELDERAGETSATSPEGGEQPGST